jgi:mannosyltransferase OCH1-like enzyme
VNVDELRTAPVLAGGIPKLIHRLWFGPEPPRRVVELEDDWRRMNPGWRVRTWREWDLPALRNQLWFDSAAHPAQRADIARLELLHSFGGIYVDTDVAPLRPVESLIAATECFFGAEDHQWLGTAIFGTRAGHPFLTKLIDGIGSSILAQPGAEPNEQTGPKYVTACHLEYARDEPHHPIAVFPPALFYPYHFSEPERRGGPFPEAYAVHEWSMSWTSDRKGDLSESN